MIGEKIKELRKKHNLTQEELAKMMCISHSAIHKYEAGISNPSRKTLNLLAEKFNDFVVADLECEVCGKLLTGRTHKYCEECSFEINYVKKKRNTDYDTQEYADRKSMKYYHNDGLIEDAKKAAELHLSYGEYMALKIRGKI